MTGFFVLCPETVGRYLGHDALGGGQWLIIAAMLLIVYYEECFMDIRFAFSAWIVLGFIAVGTHMYFAGILFFCMVGYCILDYISPESVNFVRMEKPKIQVFTTDFSFL